MQNWPGYLADLLLFGLLFFGLGFPFASRLKIPAIEKLLIAGVVFDFVFGVVMQNSVQAMMEGAWYPPADDTLPLISQYSRIAQANFALKQNANIDFLGDALASWKLCLTVVASLSLFITTMTVRLWFKKSGNIINSFQGNRWT